MFGIYMILAGVERFFIELIRVNTKYHVAGISIYSGRIHIYRAWLLGV